MATTPGVEMPAAYRANPGPSSRTVNLNQPQKGVSKRTYTQLALACLGTLVKTYSAIRWSATRPTQR